MKIFHYFIIFFTLFSFTKVESIEIKILALVNNRIISNYDMFNEIKFQELLYNRTISQSQYSQILQQMIGELIKEIEVKKNNISIDRNDLNIKVNEILSQIPEGVNIDTQTKSYIESKIENSIKWNNLILMKFRNKIEINKNEIDQMIKSKELDEKEKERMIKIEKNKKLQVFSKTYFNEIKKKYFTKLY